MLREFKDPLFALADPRLLRRFFRFHINNQTVYAEFEKYARQIRSTGRTSYSAWVIVQVIRWEYDLRTKGDVFQINNDFIAIYARLFVVRNPAIANIFELREMKPVRKLSREDADRQGVRQAAYGG